VAGVVALDDVAGEVGVEGGAEVVAGGLVDGGVVVGGALVVGAVVFGA
jgi:hypothetical protein